MSDDTRVAKQRYTKGIERPACPACGVPLSRVYQSSPQMLNADQFDAVKAGDWFCEDGTCDPDEGLSYSYYRDREVVLPDRRNRTRRAPESPEPTPEALRRAWSAGCAYAEWNAGYGPEPPDFDTWLATQRGDNRG